MKNKVSRVIIGIIVVVGLLIGIYFILPGQVKMPLKETIQSITMKFSEDVTRTLKNATVPNNSTTFGSMMARYKGSAWTIGDKTVDAIGNGTMVVYADCFKCTVKMENQMTDDNSITHTNAHVRLTFDVTREGEKVTKATLRTVSVDQVEYDKDNPYYQLALDSMCKN